MNLSNGILDQFNFPGEGTLEALKAQNLQANVLNSTNGQAVQFLAHDKGVAFRFFIHPVYSKEQSRILKYQKYEDIEMIEYFVSKDFKPVERLHLLPPEFLDFEKEITEVPTSDKKDIKEKIVLGKAISGKYFESYTKWKEGLETPGLPISKWGVFSDGESATLAQMGIFSVEQLAAKPRSSFNNPNMPAVFLEGFEQAIQYVNGKINRSGEERLAKQILSLELEKNASDRAVKELQTEMAAMRKLLSSGKDKPAKKKPGRKPGKAKVLDGVIVETDEAEDESL